jgi:alkane 1-monooxygenase
MAFAPILVAPDGSQYTDTKRYSWLASLLIPLLALAGPLLYLYSGQGFWLLALPLFIYGAIPLLDIVLGEDHSNPPEQVIAQLEADGYYRCVLYAQVGIIWAVFLFSAWFVGNHDLAWYQLLAVALTTGLICGFGFNLGHELGHKKSRLERTLARLVLGLGAYGHFNIEHNQGHHRDVSTPGDTASARMGESIYRFALREMPGGARRAWRLECERLERADLPCWSRHNGILQPLLLTVVLYGGLVWLFGPVMLVYLPLVALWGAFQLTSANYVEHYGLLRRKLDDGRYERCQPHHSWNSNHVFSNWITFHLQRHSDHHAFPARRYQSLRNHDGVPTLPAGYTALFLMAYLPALWFRVMDPRLLEAVQHDPGRINFQPSERERLVRRDGLVAGG